MGPDSYNKPVFYLDGQLISTDIPLLDLTPAGIESEFIDAQLEGQTGKFLAPGGLTVTLRLKRMTRKRLKKMLMAAGISRNCTESMARTWGGHYALNLVRYLFEGPSTLTAAVDIDG